MAAPFILPNVAAAQSFMQSAKCGVPYDKWNVQGAPASTLATVGMAHESFAARDCLSKNNTARACEHYRSILSAFDRMGSSAPNDLRPDIEGLMKQAGCK
jgi:hypothetical protein